MIFFQIWISKLDKIGNIFLNQIDDGDNFSFSFNSIKIFWCIIKHALFILIQAKDNMKSRLVIAAILTIRSFI